MKEFLFQLLSLIAIAFILKLSKSKARGDIYRNQYLVLSYTKEFIWMMIFLTCILPLGFLIWLYFKAGLNTINEVVGFCIMLVLFSFSGLFFYRIKQKDFVLLGSTGIIKTYVFRKSKTINWDEICSIKYSRFNRELCFETIEGRKIKVSFLYKGFASFCEKLVFHINKEEFKREITIAYNDVSRA